MRNKHNIQASTKDYDIVVHLLQKKEKSMKDLEIIYNKISLLNGFNMFIQNYFQGSDISEQIKLCGDLVYQKLNKGDIIFEQDEASNNKLYIILKGSSMVFLKKDLDFQDEEEQQQTTQVQNQTADKRGSLSHIPDLEEKEIKKISLTILDKLKQISQKYKKHIDIDFSKEKLTNEEISDFKKRYGKTTRLLNEGSVFGERALLTNQARTATIIAASHPTELVMLDREKFLPALEELKRTLQLRRDILFQIFKDMDNYSSARLESMLYTFQVQSFNRGHYITEQDQKDDKIYIIADGEAQILKKIEIQISENQQIEKFAKLTIIGPGVMVGDEIMLRNDQSYLYTTEVISVKAQLLVADKKIIDRKFPKDLRDHLKKIALNKEKGRKVLLQNKEEDLKVEAFVKLQNQKNQKYLQENDRSQEEKIKIAQIYKDSKQTVYEKELQAAQKAQAENSNNPNNNATPEIYKGSIQSQKQESNIQFNLPQIIDSIKLSPQTQNIFDVKNLVFDFGDGKNLQNAHRIEKILNAKHRKSKIQYQINPNILPQNIQQNINQIKSTQDLKILQLANQTDLTNIHSFTVANRVKESQTQRNEVFKSNNKIINEEETNQNNHQQNNQQLFSSHTRYPSNFQYSGSELPISPHYHENQVFPALNPNLSQQTLSVIHSSKNKQIREGEDQKPQKRQLSSKNTLNKQIIYDQNENNGQLNLSLMTRSIFKSQTVMTKKLMKENENSLIFQAKLKESKSQQQQNGPSLPSLFNVDGNQSIEDTNISTKDQLDIAHVKDKNPLPIKILHKKQKNSFSSLRQKQDSFKQKSLQNNQRQNSHLQNQIDNINQLSIDAKLNEKINELQQMNSQNNIYELDQEKENDNQPQYQLHSPIQIVKQYPKISNYSSHNSINYNHSSSNHNFSSININTINNSNNISQNTFDTSKSTRNTGFFPLTVSKPNKVYNLYLNKASSLRKISQKIEKPTNLGPLSIFQRQLKPNKFNSYVGNETDNNNSNKLNSLNLVINNQQDNIFKNLQNNQKIPL